MLELLIVQNFCDIENFWRSMFKPSFAMSRFLENFVTDYVETRALNLFL